ncbi:hypothetical protein MASR2M17_00500 [Aminivibrio sp.]
MYSEKRLNLPFMGIASFSPNIHCNDLDTLAADIAILGMPCDIAIQRALRNTFGPRAQGESTCFLGLNGTYDRKEMILRGLHRKLSIAVTWTSFTEI